MPDSQDQPESTAPAVPPHQRRVRYRGTHPRRFAEKYKEHDPARYAEAVQKVIESGKTPAGTHRAICVAEIMDILAPQPGEIAVDATLGYGGHAAEILKAILPGGCLYGLDADPVELPRTEARLRATGIPAAALIVRRTNFAGLPQFLAAENAAAVDIILADLGVSSMQIDNPERGFSFKLKGPLDARMNPQRGQSAAVFLANVSENDLVELLQENSDEPRAKIIAGGLCAARLVNPIVTTQDLTRQIEKLLWAQRVADAEIEKSVRRTFQALRIAVNDEFSALETFLRNLPLCLRPGGRVTVLTFHSGEDRRVKKAFQAGQRAGHYSRIADDVIRPQAEEIRANPRAASAKLRWAIRAV